MISNWSLLRGRALVKWLTIPSIAFAVSAISSISWQALTLLLLIKEVYWERIIHFRNVTGYGMWWYIVYIKRVGCSLTKLCKCQGTRKAGDSTGTSLQPSWEAEHLGVTRGNPTPWHQVPLWSSRAMARQGRAVGSWRAALLQHHWGRGWWLWGPEGLGPGQGGRSPKKCWARTIRAVGVLRALEKKLYKAVQGTF